MKDSPAILAQIKARLEQSENVAIATHIRPDGDAVGSILGLGRALSLAGKKVAMVMSDPVPSSFHHLEGCRAIKRALKNDYDTYIIVDCADFQRIGGVFQDHLPDIQIDHHITNPGYAKINYVDPDAVATAEILANILEPVGLSIDLDVASALLTGIITDTIGFRTSNMTPQALRSAAALMEEGADLPRLYYEGLIQRTFSAARYWGMGLSSLQKKGRIIWATLTQADRVAVGYNGNDDADLTNMLSSITESDVAVLFIEQKQGQVKVSWRAQPGLNISEIAVKFGGGGHPAAAGADVTGTLEEVQAQVLAATEAYLQTNGSKSH
jgi:phosphoesterase RecJ-like protein